MHASAHQAKQQVPQGTANDAPMISFLTSLRFWLKLGFISFGGPAGQIAVMHEELVVRRRWISEKRFLHALNYCMLLPGPEAQQLATYIGWLLHGTWGGIVAGGLFVLPSLFILMGLSALYVAYGDVPAVQGVLYGVQPAVVAIVAAAVWRIGKRAVRHGVTLALAASAFVALLFEVPFPLIILGAGILGVVGGRIWPKAFAGGGHGGKHVESYGPAIIDDHHEVLEHTRPSKLRFATHLMVGLMLWAAPLAVLVAWQQWDGTLARMGVFFTKAALVTFGGAYAVLPYVNDYAIDAGWLSGDQMIHGLALGETTPGPLIMVVAFVGFVGGWQRTGMGWTGAVAGCCVATYFTFLPSFLFILLGAPFIERMRGELRLNAALSGITAAIVGVVLHLAYDFGLKVFFTNGGIDPWSIAIAAAAFVALWRFKQDVVRVVVAAGVVGLAISWVA
jgi:chromate transporter